MILAMSAKRLLIRIACLVILLLIAAFSFNIGKKHGFILENKNRSSNGIELSSYPRELIVELSRAKEPVRVIPNFNQAVESHGKSYKIQIYEKGTKPQLLKQTSFKVDHDIDIYTISIPLLLADDPNFFFPFVKK